jgi:hypothetical protein
MVQKQNEPSGVNFISGTIVNVISSETASETVVKSLTKGYPGLVLGVVRGDNGITYSCYFEDNDEALHLLYGNSILLIGRRCKVIRTGTDTSGRIKITSDPITKTVPVAESCVAFDIGSII